MVRTSRKYISPVNGRSMMTRSVIEFAHTATVFQGMLQGFDPGPLDDKHPLSSEQRQEAELGRYL
jgi:hypothetical protein